MRDSTVACISGAGLVGALWSILLAKRGQKVRVFERRTDLRKAGAEEGRSINLALSDRGWRALKIAGVKDNIREIAIPMYGRMIHDEKGTTRFLPYGKENQAIWSVSRSGLNAQLLDLADSYDNVELNFQLTTTEVDFENKTLNLQNKNGEFRKSNWDTLYGTDGAFSVVRDNLIKSGRYNYSQTFIEHGYKELSILPGSDGKWQMNHNSLHIWPRKRFMLIALPNLDGSFTVTLFLAFENDQESFANLHNEKQVLKFFSTYFPDALELMPQLTEEFFANPVSGLVTIRCAPWNRDDDVLLLGDAAHAIVPFFGQGMNAGFEDCTLLYNMLEHSENKSGLFKRFSDMRIPDANAIADLALDNFIEMRDKVADKRFLLKKELEKKIVKLLPNKWMPLYSMVTFSHIPYSEAQKRGYRQDRILGSLLDNNKAESLLSDAGKLEQYLEEYLNK